MPLLMYDDETQSMQLINQNLQETEEKLSKVMCDKYGAIEGCRSFINCEMCKNVEAIHIISAEDMTQDLFIEKYKNFGQPVLIKNAAKDWAALEKFGFEFFKQLYLNLSSPVLKNELDECEFLSWNFDFKNISVCQKIYIIVFTT